MKKVISLTAEQTRAADEQAALMADYRRSIRRFIRDMWNLSPQPVRPEYEAEWATVSRATGATWERLKKTVQPEWFGVCNNKEMTGEARVWEWYDGHGGYITSREDFVKHGYYSWQQDLILMGIEKGIAGDAERKISVRSGHGIGKSATCAWVTLWFLYCFYEAQVPVTAPTSSQMHDVLWKELSIWIKRMPKDQGDLYEWSRDYVRIVYAPESWFARARTSTKENTEAIAGVHSDHVCIVVDEGSGVPEQVYETAEGALTSGNVFVIIISNPTRTIGYFYDTHHKNAADWQLYGFSSEDSPLVAPRYVQGKLKHGRDSEEFGIRVAGIFPSDGVMDDTGYLQLIPRDKINIRLLDMPFMGRKILGIDPAGEGKDRATFVLRDRFKAKLIHEMQTSNDKQIAEATLGFIEHYKIDPRDVVIGSFGVGADVGKEVAIASQGRYNIYSVMEGNAPDKEEEEHGDVFQRTQEELQNPENDPSKWTDIYLNIRALMYFRARNWLLAGGEFVDTSVDNSEFVNEMVMVRYKRTLHGNRIQLMSKKEMLKLRIQSPNIADALSLTFLRSLDDSPRQSKEELERIDREENELTGDDRFNTL